MIGYGILHGLGGARGLTGSGVSNLDQLLAFANAGGGNSAVHDYARATVTAGIWTSLDLSANGKHHTQAVVSQQPAISTAGAFFDGLTDNVRQNIAGGTFSIVLSFEKGSSTNGFILTNQASIGRLRYLSGSGGGLPLTDVNGLAVATEGALFTALEGAGRVVVTARNLNFTADTQIQIGRGGSAAMLGTVRWVIVLDHAALGANLAAALALARLVAAS